MKEYKCPDCNYTSENTGSVAGHVLTKHNEYIFDKNLDQHLNTIESYQTGINEHKQPVAPTHTKEKQTKNKGFIESLIQTLKSILSR